MGYILTTEAMRVVQRNDRGNVTYRKRYKKGDEVDVDRLEEGRLEALLEAGSLVDSSDAEQDDDDAESPQGQPVATGTDAGSTATQGAGPVSSVDEAGGDSEDDIEASDDAGGDLYDGMSYTELQQEAKSRGLNAGGNAEDLRGRLRDDDGSENDGSGDNLA